MIVVRIIIKDRIEIEWWSTHPKDHAKMSCIWFCCWVKTQTKRDSDCVGETLLCWDQDWDDDDQDQDWDDDERDKDWDDDERDQDWDDDDRDQDWDDYDRDQDWDDYDRNQDWDDDDRDQDWDDDDRDQGWDGDFDVIPDHDGENPAGLNLTGLDLTTEWAFPFLLCVNKSRTVL